MNAIDFSRFERHTRTTVPSDLIENPELLYDFCTFASQNSVQLGDHYDGKLMGAVAPLWGESSLFGEPSLKIVSAGNFKPVKEDHPDDTYTRVCAEQNLIDNSLRVGDILLGAMFIRSSKPVLDLEGNKDTEAPHLCQPCRTRALPILGHRLVIVSFVGDSPIPVEAMTIEQSFNYHDFNKPLEVMARGADVKEFIIEEVFKTSNHASTITRLPRLPSRRYTRN